MISAPNHIQDSRFSCFFTAMRSMMQFQGSEQKQKNYIGDEEMDGALLQEGSIFVLDLMNITAQKEEEWHMECIDDPLRKTCFQMPQNDQQYSDASDDVNPGDTAGASSVFEAFFYSSRHDPLQLTCESS